MWWHNLYNEETNWEIINRSIAQTRSLVTLDNSLIWKVHFFLLQYLLCKLLCSTTCGIHSLLSVIYYFQVSVMANKLKMNSMGSISPQISLPGKLVFPRWVHSDYVTAVLNYMLLKASFKWWYVCSSKHKVRGYGHLALSDGMFI